MTKEREALKQALEALGHFEKAGLATLKTIDAIIAVRECLEQQNQFNPDRDAMAVMVEEQQRMAKRIAELEAQPEQPYPDNFIHALMYDVAKRDSEAQQSYEDAFVNGTGVMLGDKRIDPASIYKQPAQQQEPVAWATQMGEYAHIHWGAKRPEYPMVYEVPLYTTPPHRKPLTDEEILHRVDTHVGGPSPSYPLDNSDWLNFARAIEAAHGIKGEA